MALLVDGQLDPLGSSDNTSAIPVNEEEGDIPNTEEKTSELRLYNGIEP